MKINDFDIKKWWHWLVIVLVVMVLVFFALLLAPAIMCWTQKLVDNTIATSDYTASNYPTETSLGQSDNHTRVIILFDPPNPPIAVEIPSGSDNITISFPSDNCSWGH